MNGWQLTAKTIYCDAVDDEVTILIYKDGSVRCTGFIKYTQPNEQTQAMIRGKCRKLGRLIKCEGEDCPRVTGYKESILQESSK
jgi:hypothetical protein